MKYESEIIHEILEQRGHEVPNLHYQSECIETWIEEYRGAYPKLCDYESEWLNYIVENPIGEFPYETVTTNSTATVNHVVPFAYKSAILTGQTLVNICSLSSSLTVETKTTSTTINNTSLLKTSTKYLIMFTSDITARISLQEFDTSNNFLYNNWHDARIGRNVVLITTNESTKRIKVFNKSTDSITISDVMILEYQDGMENWNIPYFTDMQSVKMPVLTTSNEDGTKTNILTVNEDVELRGIGDVQDTINLNTGEYAQRIEEVILNGSESWQVLDSNTENTIGFSLRKVLPLRKTGDKYVKVNCDKLPSYKENLWYNDKIGCVAENNINQDLNDTQLQVRVLKSNLSTQDTNGFKSWLQTNPLTIQYILETPVIKTVDLTVVNQDGDSLSKIKPIEGTMHINVSGTPLAPTAVLEVPVEAITQNLASFIEEE